MNKSLIRELAETNQENLEALALLASVRPQFEEYLKSEAAKGELPTFLGSGAEVAAARWTLFAWAEVANEELGLREAMVIKDFIGPGFTVGVQELLNEIKLNQE